MIFSIIATLILLEVLWTVFGFYMCMRAAWLAKTLSKTAIALGILPLVVGFVADVLFNLIASALFLQWMPTWTLSQRVQQLVNTGSGWRKSLALWTANLLNSVSLGGPHITIPKAQ